MPLTTHQISNLLGLVVTTEPDDLECDQCFGDIASFAEATLAGREIPDAFNAIQIHLQQCPCCKDEYQALLEGLSELQSS